MLPVVRDYKDTDYEGVSELWDRTGMGGFQRGDDPDIIQNTLKNGGKLLVMFLPGTGKIVGTSWLTNDGRRIYLHHFGILPEFQGRGWSRILLQASLNFARSTRMQCKLEVHRENNRALELYKKAGFRYLGDYEVYIIRDYRILDNHE